jgi:hypothetical protein
VLNEEIVIGLVGAGSVSPGRRRGIEVFIYNFKQSGAEFEYDGSEWTQYKVSNTAYVIIELNSDDANFVNVWSVDTWKEKDEDGVMHKYYEVQGMFTFELIQAQIGNKLMWIIPIGEDTDHGLLTGQAKTRKTGTENHTIAATLTGYFIWHESDGDDKDEGAGTMSLRINSKMTNDWHSLGGEEASNAIVDYLESKNYEPYY